ncbi:MAG TPA: hypothetical protein VHZ03_18210, partial [Trebonia sp.]|nr:hypothetical protein [Trebonia sp.]
MPALADSCTVLLPAGKGLLRTAAVIHRDPAKAAILEELRAIDIPLHGAMQAAHTQARTQIVAGV